MSTEITLKKLQWSLDNPVYQLRVKLDPDALEAYKLEYEKKDHTMPPIEVRGVMDEQTGNIELHIVDGFHRARTAFDMGLKAIQANVKNCTHAEALKEALKANASNGVHRNDKDKRKAILAALKEFGDCSNVIVAKMCCVSDKTVAKWRTEFERCSEIPNTEKRTDTTGREQPATKPKAEKQRQPVVDEPVTPSHMEGFPDDLETVADINADMIEEQSPQPPTNGNKVEPTKEEQDLRSLQRAHDGLMMLWRNIPYTMGERYKQPITRIKAELENALKGAIK